MSKIVVIGSSNMDLVVQVPRCPEAGETIFGTSFTTTPGGKGANQAVAVARIGGSLSFVTRLGHDAFGEQMRQHFLHEGMDPQHILCDAQAPTGTALITVEEQGENRIIVIPGANALLSTEDIEKALPELTSCTYVLTQLEIPLDTVAYLAEKASEQGKRLILNPAPARPLPDSLLKQVFLITPNETEAEILTGIKVCDEASALQAATWFMEKGVRQVIITLGSKGAFVCTRDFQGLIPSYKVQATDTTAAGDVFNGAVTVALSEGKALTDAARFGCAASAIAVTRRGAQASIPTRKEVDTFLKEREGYPL